ncbi:hypothetical protein MVES_001002 [Malassezia vespertilionis]|uniref:CRAL-TRIO domain-containing protein n=1 Tax=Malassezia vespertilionis TaxID=2020962 RepID=A0A2N1JEV5_9BASI|nr:hypothetical protein MVES_001002 [Malassezia vespertilionis]
MSGLFGLGAKKETKKAPEGPRTSETIVFPPQGYKPGPPPELQAGDEEKLAELMACVAEFRAAHPCDPAYAQLEEDWVNKQNIAPRYLRAARGDLKNAKRRIIPELITPDEVAPEAVTGKHVLTGFDKECRPILYLRPGRENTKQSERQIRYMVFSLERSLVVDFQGASLSSMPSLSSARQVAHILQAHYVERLGRAFVVHTPRFISAFFTALSPFLDPVTKDKIRFNSPNMTDFILPSQLDDNFPGGEYPYEFNFHVYWDTLLKRCNLNPDGTRITKNAAQPTTDELHRA